MSGRGANLLKRTLVGGWALWWTVVLASNLADAGKVLGRVPEGWAFASGNYGFISQTTARYEVPAWVNGVLFAGVIVWEASATVLFWLACGWRRWRYPAFTAGLGLWLAFLVADEICIAYAVEATHLRLLIAQLLTLLALELVPD